MREYPWCSRQLTWQHLRRFGLIHDQWRLTRIWVEATGQPQTLLGRKGVTPGLDEVGEILRWWEQVPQPSERPDPICHDELLGALSPEECLERLGAAVRIQQSLVLEQILRKVADSRQRLLVASEEAGRGAASAAGGVGSSCPADLRDAHASVVQGPFSCILSQDPAGVVVERVTDSSLDWIELECPHRDRLFEVGPVAEVLCDLHAAWRSGYFKGLDPAWSARRLPPDPVTANCRFTVTA